MSEPSLSTEPANKSDEWKMFIFVTVFLFPILAVIGVGGYGFLIWILQMFAGPPGPGSV
jgi:nitrate reductase NapE